MWLPYNGYIAWSCDLNIAANKRDLDWNVSSY